MPQDKYEDGIANQIVNHFFEKGALVSISDYKYVDQEIKKAKIEVLDDIVKKITPELGETIEITKDTFYYGFRANLKADMDIIQEEINKLK